MQTNTSRGMQTMEQSLADLIQRGVVTFEVGLTRSSRPAQLIGLLERAGFPVDLPPDLSKPLTSSRSPPDYASPGVSDGRPATLEEGASLRA